MACNIIVWGKTHLKLLKLLRHTLKYKRVHDLIVWPYGFLTYTHKLPHKMHIYLIVHIKIFVFVHKTTFFAFFGLWLADKLTIHSVPCSWILGFYKPTIPQSPPSHLHKQQCQFRVFINFCSKLWSKWMVPEKWSP